MSRVWTSFGTGLILESIDFEITETQGREYRGTSHEVTDTTVRVEIITVHEKRMILTTNVQCLAR